MGFAIFFVGAGELSIAQSIEKNKKNCDFDFLIQLFDKPTLFCTDVPGTVPSTSAAIHLTDECLFLMKVYLT